MKKFRLYYEDNSGKDHLLTEYDLINTENNIALTFDEQLTEEENNKYRLEFKTVAQLGRSQFSPQFNPIQKLKIGRKLKLYLGDSQSPIWLIITSISPENQLHNIVYNISAQDYASYYFSRNGIGLEFSSFEDEDFLEEGISSTITGIGNHILRKSGLQKMDYTNQTNVIKIFDYKELKPTLVSFKNEDGINLNHNGTYSFSCLDYKIIGNKMIFNGAEINFKLSSTVNVGKNIEKAYLTIVFFENDAQYAIDFLLSPYISYEWGTGRETYFKERFDFELVLKNDELEHIIDGTITGIDNGIKAQGTLPKTNLELEWPTQFEISINGDIFSFKKKYLYVSNGGSKLSIEFKKGDFIYTADPNFSFINSISSVGVYNDINESSWKVIDETNSEKTSLEVSNSNTYNALIELANNTNAYLFFDYENKKIIFLKKDDMNLNTNYYLSPDVDIENFSLDYDGADFYNILHVRGGGDEYGIAVGIQPNITEEAFDFFTATSGAVGAHMDVTYTENKIGTFYQNILGKNSFEGLEPANWLANTDSKSEEYIKNLEFAKIADKIPYLDSFLINFDYFKENDLIDNNVYDEIFNEIYNKLRMINIKYQYWIRKKYEAEYNVYKFTNDIRNAAEKLPKAGNNAPELLKELEKMFYVREDDGIKYPFFDSIYNYKGIQEVYIKLEEYKNIIKDLIKEREDLYKEIYKLEKEIEEMKEIIESPEYEENPTLEENLTNKEVELVNKEELIEGYLAAVGNWQFNKITNLFIKSELYGMYSYIWDAFEKYYSDFIILKGTSHITSIYDKYKSVSEEKENFWFDFKENYGKYWIEGFYENDIETDPIKLYNEASLYFNDINKPSENYNITYINIYDIIGINREDIKVGSIIKINASKLGVLNNSKIELQVSGINRNLRNLAGTSLTVSKVRYTDKILEKLLLGIK